MGSKWLSTATIKLASLMMPEIFKLARDFFCVQETQRGLSRTRLRSRGREILFKILAFSLGFLEDVFHTLFVIPELADMFTGCRCVLL